ncbi:Abi family protein [Flavobacterium sp. TAB 87]|uniref:Abi family protein n=1 Tax=Flavobacterium sp. TAB 87 TaxID=1729581 RepID=UPI00076C974B|nr:Abi family protein [Flavobacterium sp. TAB 87]KVV16414.1 Abortive infection bacteriophage resistance protein [Flavobacterium sp. TAB 87]
MEYNKPPLTHLEQAELWKSRGLKLEDRSRAIRYLTNISYYRLSAYAIPFQNDKDVFNEGASFSHILNLYLFDRELRLIIFNAIERLEVSFRARMVYQLSHKYGSHWQDNAKIYKDPHRLKNRKTGEFFTVDIFSEIQDMIGKSTKEKHPETFIKHYKNTYNKPTNPPSWMCLEVLTLGQLSKLYNGLKDNVDKQNIATDFGVHHAVFSSWLHTLTYVRNICGHHGRLWNREIAIEPLWLLKPKMPWISGEFENVTNRTFYALCIIKYLLNTANPSHHIKQHFIDLIKKYPDTPIQFMGIPSTMEAKLFNWENEPLWN